MPTEPGADATLEQLLEGWFLRVENGEQPTPAEHCADHPELLDAFQRLLGHTDAVEDLLGGSQPAADPDQPMPERLGEFEVLLPIGSGGAGDVYLARQTSLQRLVALKVLRPTGDRRSRQRLQREAEVAASLEHPGIVPIYGVGDDGERAWIAMKWLTGPALDQLTEPLEPHRAATAIASAARALHEAHSVGIIHRDIKPSNIVLDHENPCIVDFGLARGADQAVRTTLEGHVAGTLLYMSPEQLSSGDSTTTLDARTDVYSLGATLYELLAGRPPFEEDVPAKVIHRILNAQPPALDRSHGIERDLAIITLRALDKDRERRFPSALAMAEDLERYLAGEPILSRPIGMTTRLVRFTRKNSRATAAVVATGLVATGLAIVLAWNVRQQEIAREATLSNVAAEIEDADLDSARSLLEPMLESRPTPDALALRGRLVACERLDDLLDRVQSLPEDVVSNDLEVALAELHDEHLPASRRHAAALVRPLALALSGRLDEARQLATALPAGRARDALTAAFEDAPGPWTLTTSGATPLEHLFTVLAMRFANRPLPERRAEIDRGRAIAFSDTRLRLQHAIQRINEGRHELAYEALSGITREDVYPRIVWRLLMREAIWIGDRAAARAHFEALLRQYPKASWSASDAASVLETQYWLDTIDRELLAWARDRWPQDWLIAVVHGRQLARTDWQAAARLLEQATEWARHDGQREESDLLRLYVRAAPLPTFWTPVSLQPDAAEAERLAALDRSAGEFAAKATATDRVTAARIVQARARLAQGDWAGAKAALVEIDDPDAPERLLEVGVQAHSWLAVESSVSQGNATEWQRQMVRRARSAHSTNVMARLGELCAPFGRLLETMSGRQRFLGRPCLAMAGLLNAEFNAFRGDPQVARESLELARPLVPPDGADHERSLLLMLEAYLDR